MDMRILSQLSLDMALILNMGQIPVREPVIYSVRFCRRLHVDKTLLSERVSGDT